MEYKRKIIIGKIMKNAIKYFLIVYSIIFSHNLYSKQITVFDWSKENVNQYYENQLSCQKIIEDIKWSNILWPKENKNKKPSRHEIISDEEIEQRIKDSMLMEIALNDMFNVEINSEMLKADIERMIRNTTDTHQLSNIFLSLNNDPKTIAECISRPYLSKSKLLANYELNSRFHGSLRELAKHELSSYLKSTNSNQISAIINKSLYSTGKSISQENFDVNHKILNEELFSQKVLELTANQSSQLIENEHAFEYEQLISIHDNYIETVRLSWLKVPFDQWVKNTLHSVYNGSQYKLDHTKKEIQFDKDLESIIHSRKVKLEESQNQWQIPDIPVPRGGHNAIWTGTEMIIWGGFDTQGLNPTPLRTGGKYNPITDTWVAMSGENMPPLICRRDYNAVWTGVELIVWDQDYSTESECAGRYNPVTNTWSNMRKLNLDDNIQSETVIWTGEYMIVWGHLNIPFASGNYGYKYNPKIDQWSEISRENAPSTRFNHTASWTGTEMIIWGGSGNVGDLNTGGRYDPVKDTWTVMNTNGAPTPRQGHVSVWTGSELIIWGGDVLFPPEENLGARYNPSSDSWVPIALNDLAFNSSDRSNKIAVWTGSEMVLWGRLNSTLSHGFRYDPVSDEWSEITNENAPNESNFSAVWTGEEMIIWGGGASLFSDRGYKYSPNSDSWINTQNSGAPPTWSGYRSVWTGNEMLVFGDSSVDMIRGGRFDPVIGRWSSISSIGAPDGRVLFNAEWTGIDTLIWGGDRLDGAKYNPMTDSWLPISNAPEGMERSNSPSIWTGNEMIIWGENSFFSDIPALSYDYTQDTWTLIPENNLFNEINAQSIVWSGNEMIVWGHSGNPDDPEESIGARYNPVTNIWSEISTNHQPNGRYLNSTEWADRYMIIWGGREVPGLPGAQESLNTGGVYDFRTDSWVPTSIVNAPQPRYSATSLWTGREMIVWGGQGFSSLRSGKRLNPETNRWASMNTFFSPTISQTGTEVWSGNAMLIYGSSNSNRMGIYYPRKHYSIGGAVSGLAEGNELSIRNMFFNELKINSNGSFTMPRPLFDMEGYEVIIIDQPTTPNQTCTISNGFGVIQKDHISNINIECTTNTYNISVIVSGLLADSELILTESPINILNIVSDGVYTFPFAIEDGISYNIELDLIDGPAQECIIVNGSGLVAGDDVSDIMVSCKELDDLIFINSFENN